MERNLELYPAYQGARGLMFWVPVFFLYFSSVLPPARVLELEAIYYAGVVVLEVPSGYLSDRLGRRPTLVAAMVAIVAAHVVFAATGTFVAFAVAQLLLAAGMAFNSGTDDALLWDSLAALGRTDEFASRAGRAQARGFAAMALAAAVGGLAAGLDLRVAYVLSALGGLVAVVVAVRLQEPESTEAAHPPVRQLATVIGRLRIPTLLWVFVFAVAAVVFNHVPYELFQPYLALLLGDQDGEFSRTPLVAGLTVAGTMLLSAGVSPRVAALQRRLGTPLVLLGALGLQAIIIGAMAATLHPLIVILIVLRGVPAAIMQPVIGASIHPLLGASIRATYLSLQSLVGRLAFAGALFGGSTLVGGLDHLDAAGLTRLLVGALALLILVGTVLGATRRVVAEPALESPEPAA